MKSGKKLLRSLSFLSLLLILSSLFAAAAFADGASVYSSNCASCHRLGTYDTSGSAPDLLAKGSLISSYFTAGVSSHKSITLTAANITDITAFINNPTPVATPLSISTATLSGTTVGTAYNQTLAAAGGTTPYTWTRSAGTLPTGLTLGTSGIISGTPTTAGTYSFTVMVTDSAATKASVTKAFSITVTAASSALSITTSSLPNATTGNTYSQTLGASGGKTPYTWSRSSGTLPTGLTLSTSGVIAGTPSATGTFSFTVRVTDSSSPTVSVTKSLSMTVSAPAALSISTSSLANATVGTAYSQTLAANGGRTPYTWSRSSGTLPTGLTLNSAGVISGTPTATGTFSFTARVRDSASTQASATKALTITVNANVPPLAISTSSLPNGVVGTVYSQNLAVTGGLAPYSWNYNGTLPAGIVVTSSGLVMGTPTAAGNFSFTVLVSDSRSVTTTQALTMTVTSIPMTDADKALFNTNCLTCHTPFGLQNRTASQIQAAISGNVGGMGTTQLRGLTSTDLAGLARALTPNTPPANNCSTCHSSTTPPPASTPGQGIYDVNCAGCHSLGTYDTAGSPDLLGRGTAVAAKFSSTHYGITLTATNQTDVATFINNPSGTPTTTPPPTQTCGSCHAIPPSTGSHSNSNHLRLSCATCHGSGYSSTTVNSITHNNGVKNVVTTIGWNASNRTCANSCHGTESW
ncbi:MAG: putative Ig domain-containing protein [Desulfuromonadales bacterium]|nr:putative Ig domain-containing protein [Desulfuromonadales bacterium]